MLLSECEKRGGAATSWLGASCYHWSVLISDVDHGWWSDIQEEASHDSHYSHIVITISTLLSFKELHNVHSFPSPFLSVLLTFSWHLRQRKREARNENDMTCNEKERYQIKCFFSWLFLNLWSGLIITSIDFNFFKYLPLIHLFVVLLTIHRPHIRS